MSKIPHTNLTLAFLAFYAVHRKLAATDVLAPAQTPAASLPGPPETFPGDLSAALTPYSHRGPIFVTWKIRETPIRRGRLWKRAVADPDAAERLRGCLGRFDRELDRSVGILTLALSAAFSDPRFRPVASSELPHLRCTVSLLEAFEPAATPVDWIVGVHGIIIEFQWTPRASKLSPSATQEATGGRGRATFLPEVAAENGWDQETTLAHLLQKAASISNRSVDDVQLSTLQTTRYQSRKVSASWADYLAFLETT